MLSAIKWNSHSARGWVVRAVSLVVVARANLQNGEKKQRRPLWKHFDDTHHWDATSEEWIPNLESTSSLPMKTAASCSNAAVVTPPVAQG
jgi:hypothetical protein